MSIQVLITTVNNNNPLNLLKKRNIKSDCIIGNQCDENKIQEIKYGGNGALYACGRCEYFEFDSRKCYDSTMLLHYVLAQKRAIVKHDAIAYEKAGESVGNEFKPKVRMERIILSSIVTDIKIFNVLKYNWFSYLFWA